MGWQAAKHCHPSDYSFDSASNIRTNCQAHAETTGSSTGGVTDAAAISSSAGVATSSLPTSAYTRNFIPGSIRWRRIDWPCWPETQGEHSNKIRA